MQSRQTFRPRLQPTGKQENRARSFRSLLYMILEGQLQRVSDGIAVLVISRSDYSALSPESFPVFPTDTPRSVWGPCEARTSIPHRTPVGIHSFPWPPLPVHQTSDVARRRWLNWIVGAETKGLSTWAPSSIVDHPTHRSPVPPDNSIAWVDCPYSLQRLPVPVTRCEHAVHMSPAPKRTRSFQVRDLGHGRQAYFSGLKV